MSGETCWLYVKSYKGKPKDESRGESKRNFQWENLKRSKIDIFGIVKFEEWLEEWLHKATAYWRWGSKKIRNERAEECR